MHRLVVFMMVLYVHFTLIMCIMKGAFMWYTRSVGVFGRRVLPKLLTAVTKGTIKLYTEVHIVSLHSAGHTVCTPHFYVYTAKKKKSYVKSYA